MKAPTKQELYDRVHALTKRVIQLEGERDGISDFIVPCTLAEPMQAGQTIMVRVPRIFRSHDV